MRVLRLFLAFLLLATASSCIMVISTEDNDPRWEVSFKYNGHKESTTVTDNPSPVSMEYSVPEFFIKEDGRVIFRFNYENIGFKLQFPNNGPFVYGKRYSFTGKEEYFDVLFDWIYNGVDYSCKDGWIEFQSSKRRKIAYTIKFQFDLVSPGGTKMQITDGVFTVYEKIEPRNTDVGLTKGR